DGSTLSRCHNRLASSQGVDVLLWRTLCPGSDREMGSSQRLPGLHRGQPILRLLTSPGKAPLNTSGRRVTTRPRGGSCTPCHAFFRKLHTSVVDLQWVTEPLLPASITCISLPKY